MKFDRPEYKNRKKILEKIEQGRDLFDRTGHRVTYVKLDDSFPEYILNNTIKYKNLIKNTER